MKVVEICAGAGGQALGLHRAGFEHQLAVELDPTAALTLERNLERLIGARPDVRVGDVADPNVWNPEDHRGVDLLAGGVPCPPFSVAGRQLGSQDERDLFAWAVELTGKVGPRALLLENVRGLSTPRFAGYRQAVADRLAELGYWSEWKLLQASEFGLAQLRPRFVLVALREEHAAHFHWPTPQRGSVTVGEALADLMSSRGWRHVGDWVAMANGVGPTIVGGSKKHGGADLGPTRARAAWAKLGVDGRGLADAAPEESAPHPSVKMPRLTNSMVARLQGWREEDDWVFAGRKTATYRQIGNAFPPPVARALGEAIANALAKGAPRRPVSEAPLHDELYRVIAAATSPMTVEEMQAMVGDPGGVQAIVQRLQDLSHDFELIRQEESHGTTFEFGGFRAFTGQSDHARHGALANYRTRRQVS